MYRVRGSCKSTSSVGAALLCDDTVGVEEKIPFFEIELKTNWLMNSVFVDLSLASWLLTLISVHEEVRVCVQMI